MTDLTTILDEISGFVWGAIFPHPATVGSGTVPDGPPGWNTIYQAYARAVSRDYQTQRRWLRRRYFAVPGTDDSTGSHDRYRKHRRCSDGAGYWWPRGPVLDVDHRIGRDGIQIF